MTHLPNPVVIVTGASSGIGEAVARLILERGGKVIAVALDRGDFGPELEKHTHWIQLDLGKFDRIPEAFEDLPDPFRAITALINCAGHDAGGRVRFDQMSLDSIASIISVNLIGTMLVTRIVLPIFIAKGAGHIVNIGSISAKESIATIAAYSASKHGVHGFTEALRADLSGTGIKVTEIVPGKTRTNFATVRWSGDAARGDAYYDDSPRGCLSAGEVAASIVWAIEQPPGVMVSEVVILPVADSAPENQGSNELRARMEGAPSADSTDEHAMGTGHD